MLIGLKKVIPRGNETSMGTYINPHRIYRLLAHLSLLKIAHLSVLFTVLLPRCISLVIRRAVNPSLHSAPIWYRFA